MGRQYVRQSFSSASCAAGDSPCASSTTLQCVVANTAAPFSRLRPVKPNPLPEAPSSLADTAAIQMKSHPKIKIASGASDTDAATAAIGEIECWTLSRGHFARMILQHADARLLYPGRADRGWLSTRRVSA